MVSEQVVKSAGNDLFLSCCYQRLVSVLTCHTGKSASTCTCCPLHVTTLTTRSFSLVAVKSGFGVHLYGSLPLVFADSHPPRNVNITIMV